jgi:hypothetical protein
MSPAPNRSEKRTVDDARLQSLLAAKERLIRDEFERKYQYLAVEVKRQRNRHTEEVQELKRQLSNCICGRARLGLADRVVVVRASRD